MELESVAIVGYLYKDMMDATELSVLDVSSLIVLNVIHKLCSLV
jgi:hypothetical protein